MDDTPKPNEEMPEAPPEEAKDETIKDLEDVDKGRGLKISDSSI